MLTLLLYSTVLLLFIPLIPFCLFYSHTVCYPLPLPFSSSSSTSILLHLISLTDCSYSSFDVLFLRSLPLYLSTLLLLYCSAHPTIKVFYYPCSSTSLLPILSLLLFCSAPISPLLFCFPSFLICSLSKSTVLLFLLLCKFLFS